MEYTLKTPLSDEDREKLRAGDRVLLSGIIYTARDAAHERMTRLYAEGEPFPIDLRTAAVYYAGPCPAKPGEVIGSCGPTTAGRMDAYTPLLLDCGLRIMIGKGARSETVMKSIVKNKAVYLGAIGGAGALIAKCIKSSSVVAYEDLGTEAIRRLEIESLPLTVLADAHGGDLYMEGISKYKAVCSEKDIIQ